MKKLFIVVVMALSMTTAGCANTALYKARETVNMGCEAAFSHSVCLTSMSALDTFLAVSRIAHDTIQWFKSVQTEASK